MTTKNLQTSIDIAAPPDQVWSVISDLKRMAEWSPQCMRMQLLGTVREGALAVKLEPAGLEVLDNMVEGRASSNRTRPSPSAH